MYEIFGFAEDFAKNSPTGYIANTTKMSVADLAFAATYSTIKAFE